MSMLSKYSVKGLMVFIYPVLKDWGLGKKKKKAMVETVG